MSDAEKYKLIDNLEVPCADISYQWISEIKSCFKIHMYFSRVIDGFNNDIEIQFERPFAVKWEDESFGLIELPDFLPKCSNPAFSQWNYPALIIKNSKWADKYAARVYSENEFKPHNLVHYAFISMNDLLHVLSKDKPNVKIIE